MIIFCLLLLSKSNPKKLSRFNRRDCDDDDDLKSWGKNEKFM